MKKIILLVLSVLVLSACSSDDDSPRPIVGFVGGSSMISSDYQSSSVGLFEFDSEGKLGFQEGFFEETKSDYTTRVLGDDVFRIGRYNIDDVTRFNVENPGLAISQYSALADVNDSTANPTDLVFVNAQKAYLFRYGTAELWEVNPSTLQRSEFFVSKIDLSHYDSEGVPEMIFGLVDGDRLFVFMQRLGGDFGFSAVKPSYVAVIDTETNQEIDTGRGIADDLKGIPLNVYNAISYSRLGNKVYIAGVDDFGGSASNSGGIDVLDLDSLDVSLLIDGIVEGVTGDVLDVAVFSDQVAYALYADSSCCSGSLYRFNPSIGESSLDAVTGYTELDIWDIARGPDSALWISVGSNVAPYISFLNPENNSPFRENIRTLRIASEFKFNR